MALFLITVIIGSRFGLKSAWNQGVSGHRCFTRNPSRYNTAEVTRGQKFPGYLGMDEPVRDRPASRQGSPKPRRL